MMESILNKYGVNYTEKNYITNPAIGRDKEIGDLIIVLLTPEKSAILVGPPGVGKTAIVEGLAYRIAQNEVPDALKGFEIINVQTAALLGTTETGESKVQLLIAELKEKEKVILFIDEIHMLMGANEDSSLDFANIFKEGLSRGSIKIVGATTTQEYETYILRDKAFTRRFQRIDVSEASQEETVKIMMGTLPKLEKETGLTLKYTDFIKERIMKFIVEMTSEYKRVYELGSRYPDCSLAILRGAFSRALFENSKEVDIFHIFDAIKTTKVVYPDVIKKAIPMFEQSFKDIISEENGDCEKEDQTTLETSSDILTPHEERLTMPNLENTRRKMEEEYPPYQQDIDVLGKLNERPIVETDVKKVNSENNSEIAKHKVDTNSVQKRKEISDFIGVGSRELEIYRHN